MIFTDSKTNATLTMFISGYQYYPEQNYYDKEWLDMSFCYHDDKNRRYLIAKDPCIYTPRDELRGFASIFRSAIEDLEVGESTWYCPLEQMPQITITKTSAYAWKVEVIVVLPNIAWEPKYMYTVTDTHVTEWQLYQYADAFTDMAIEWPGNGKHIVPKERMPEEATAIHRK